MWNLFSKRIQQQGILQLIHNQYNMNRLFQNVPKYNFSYFTRQGGVKRSDQTPRKDRFKKISYMKRVDFGEKDMKFPIRIPLRYRYIYRPTKKLFIDWDDSKIKFQRLLGNQILLAFQDIKILTPQQILIGLERLAIQPDQQKYNWRQHPWINAAFQHIKTNSQHYKLQWTMRFYNLMKTLRNDDPDMWKMIYARLQKVIFKVDMKTFIYFWQKYHNNMEVVSQQFRTDLMGLMESKLRHFPASNMVNAFKILFQTYNKIDHFRLQSVFSPMLRSPAYPLNPTQINDVLKILTFLNHEKNPRLYDGLYSKILKTKFTDPAQIKTLMQTLREIKDIFPSHNVDPYLQYLKQIQNQVKVKSAQAKAVVRKKELYQIVIQDLKYFKQKKKIEKQMQTNQTSSV